MSFAKFVCISLCAHVCVVVCVFGFLCESLHSCSYSKVWVSDIRYLMNIHDILNSVRHFTLLANLKGLWTTKPPWNIHRCSSSTYYELLLVQTLILENDLPGVNCVLGFAFVVIDRAKPYGQVLEGSED